MYVRSFKAAEPHESERPWLTTLLHVGALLLSILIGMKLVLSFVWGFQEHGFSGATAAAVAGAQWVFIAGMVVVIGILRWFARNAGTPQFDQHNAIDVETMGLYWHFVDIVWIVIFTAVYLLEYL
jgi:cytochrome o ubiquinol oxidase subunit 3